MDKIAAQTLKKLYTEAFSLNPSAIIQLFTIDVGQIGFNRGVISQNEIDTELNTVFRFHSHVKLTTNSLFWKGKEYTAAPINVEGFEITSKGTLPIPKLSIAVSDEGIPQLSILKDRIYSLVGDLVGAKVTRTRTFAKFLDAENYYDGEAPNGFSPDPNQEFPPDIYFIDRKSNENKNILEFELASVLDVENIKLPGRLVSSNSCPFMYRDAANGCPYLSDARRNPILHNDIILPQNAPACANEKDELFHKLYPNIAVVDKGQWDKFILYNQGEQVFISHNNIDYYFISKINNNNIPPPNISVWFNDACSKTQRGCQIRFGQDGFQNGLTPGHLPFGGFSSVLRFN